MLRVLAAGGAWRSPSISASALRPGSRPRRSTTRRCSSPRPRTGSATAATTPRPTTVRWRQIDQANVAGLTEAWSVEVGSQGKIETTPIVWNGTLYGTSTWSVVYAVDARTGALKWRWDPALVKGGFAEGGAALLLRTGQPRRGHLQGPGLRRPARRPAGRARRRERPRRLVGADHAGRRRLQHHRRAADREGQASSSATAAASTACAATSPPTTPTPASRRGAGSWCPAIRPRASRTARWRWPLKTWKGEWWKYGGGGTPWDGIAYDPEANLVYVGTGNGSPWARDHRSAGRRRQPLPVVDRRAQRRHRPLRLALPDHARRRLGLQRRAADDPGRPHHRRQAAQGADAGAEERLLLRARPAHRRAALGAAVRRR